MDRIDAFIRYLIVSLVQLFLLENNQKRHHIEVCDYL